MLNKFLKCVPDRTHELTPNSPLLNTDSHVISTEIERQKKKNVSQKRSSVALVRKLRGEKKPAKIEPQEMSGIVYPQTSVSTKRRLCNRTPLARLTLSDLLNSHDYILNEYTLSLSPEEKYLLVCAPKSTEIMVFETEEGFLKVGSFQFADDSKTRLGGSVASMVALPRQNVMLIGGFANGIACDFSIRVFKFVVGDDFKVSQVSTLKGHKGCVEKISLSADGLFLVSLARDFKILLWDLRDLIRTGKVVRPYGRGIPRASSSGDISLVSVSEYMNGALCVVGYANKTFHLWQIETEKTIKTFTLENPHDDQDVVSLAWGKRDSALRFFSSTSTGEVKVWLVSFAISSNTTDTPQILDFDLIRTLSCHNSDAIGIVRNGNFLITTDKQTARVWNTDCTDPYQSSWICEYRVEVPDEGKEEPVPDEECDDGWVDVRTDDYYYCTPEWTSLELGVSKFVIWSEEGAVVWPLLSSFDSEVDQQLFSRVEN